MQRRTTINDGQECTYTRLEPSAPWTLESVAPGDDELSHDKLYEIEQYATDPAIVAAVKNSWVNFPREGNFERGRLTNLQLYMRAREKEIDNALPCVKA